MLTLPALPELEHYQKPSNPIDLYASRIFLESLLGQRLSFKLKDILKFTTASCSLSWPMGQGARKLKALAWRLLTVGGDVELRKDLLKVVQGNSMTMTKAALTSLQPIDCQERELALKHFYHRWKDRPVVLDSWFYFESSTPRTDSLARAQMSALKHETRIRPFLDNWCKPSEPFRVPDGDTIVCRSEELTAKEILDVEDVVASIILVEDLRIQRQ